MGERKPRAAKRIVWSTRYNLLVSEPSLTAKSQGSPTGGHPQCDAAEDRPTASRCPQVTWLSGLSIYTVGGWRQTEEQKRQYFRAILPSLVDFRVRQRGGGNK